MMTPARHHFGICHTLAGSLLAGAVLLAGCGKTGSTKPSDQLLEQGWVSFRLEEFDKADAQFRGALLQLDRAKTAAGGDDAAAARLRLNALYGRGLVASLGRRGEQAGSARQYFEQVISLDPAGEMGAWAALALVRDQHVQRGSSALPDLGVLEAAYAAVIQRYPGTAAAEEAFMYRASLLVQTFSREDAAQAVLDLQNYLDHAPPESSGKLRTALYGLLSQAHQTLKQFPQALAAMIASLDAKENDPANPNQNNILEYYRIGMMAQYDVGDLACARAYYQRFLREYPRDQRAFNVALMLRHLGDTEAQLRAGEPVTEISSEGGRR